MNELTWTCHVCGKRRPDSFISVFTRDESAEYKLPLGTLKTNVRYCNDKEACIKGAPLVKFTKKG